MREVRWSLLKNERLKKTRGLSFEDLIQQGRLVAVRRHPSRALQDIVLFERKGYIWVVPFVRKGDAIFLKTLYPSRKYTALHTRGAL